MCCCIGGDDIECESFLILVLFYCLSLVGGGEWLVVCWELVVIKLVFISWLGEWWDDLGFEDNVIIGFICFCLVGGLDG